MEPTIVNAIRFAAGGIQSQERGLRAAEETIQAEHVAAHESPADRRRHEKGIARMRDALEEARRKFVVLMATALEHGVPVEDVARAAGVSADDIWRLLERTDS